MRHGSLRIQCLFVVSRSCCICEVLCPCVTRLLPWQCPIYIPNADQRVALQPVPIDVHMAAIEYRRNVKISLLAKSSANPNIVYSISARMWHYSWCRLMCNPLLSNARVMLPSCCYQLHLLPQDCLQSLTVGVYLATLNMSSFLIIGAS